MLDDPQQNEEKIGFHKAETTKALSSNRQGATHLAAVSQVLGEQFEKAELEIFSSQP